MNRSVFALAVCSVAFAALLGACGSDGGNNGVQPVNPDAGAGDGAPRPDVDGGLGDGPVETGSSLGYPATHSRMPPMVNAGGPILTAVKLVTVTWPNDAMRTRLEQFGDTITATPWWNAIVSEYGIGSGSSGGHVRMAAAADTQYTDSARGGASSIQDLIKTSVANGTFPAPTAQTLYVLYFPQTTTITIDGNGKSCTSFGGYHISVDVTPPGGATVTVPYAVVPRCPDQVTQQITETSVTAYASHEIAEAVTNVTPTGTRGWAMPPTSPWGATLPENGDLCHNDELAAQIAFRQELGTDQVSESTFAVQRSWSNASSAANHDPCVPIPQGVYFNAAPTIDVVQLAVGASGSIEVDAYSEGPTDAWTLQAFDIGGLLGLGNTLGFAFDKTLVNNGDKVSLTITLNSAPPGGETIFWIISKGKTRAHMWPVVVVKK